MSWSTVRADQFCTLITDGTHDSPKPQQSGWKLITSKHLKGHYIDFDSANWISEADYLKVISRSAVEQWDILFSMIGTIGNIYLEKNPHVEYACKNMGIFKFSGNKENALWMYYYLRSPQAKAYIQTHLRGSTQAYVPLGGLREMPVPVPPQTVRNEIIAILRPIDEKIECNNAINDNLMQQAVAIFKSWFVEYSPFDGIAPKEWKTVNLEKITALICRGIAPKYSDNSNQTVINQKCQSCDHPHLRSSFSSCHLHYPVSHPPKEAGKEHLRWQLRRWLCRLFRTPPFQAVTQEKRQDAVSASCLFFGEKRRMAAGKL